MQRNSVASWITWGLVTIGAINWGLRGTTNYNLVHSLLGWNPTVERAAYILVGAAGLLSMFRTFQITRHGVGEGFGTEIHRAA